MKCVIGENRTARDVVAVPTKDSFSIKKDLFEQRAYGYDCFSLCSNRPFRNTIHLLKILDWLWHLSALLFPASAPALSILLII